MSNDLILTLSCPDRTGIVHAVSGFLLNINGNIIDSQQFGDPESQQFFLRIHFTSSTNLKTIREGFVPIAEKFQMQ